MESFRQSRRKGSLPLGKLLIASVLGAVCVGGTSVQAQSNYEPYPFATFRGTAGVPGSTDGGDGAARFYNPTGVAVDQAGNVYVMDSNSTIRKITSDGIVSTLAGSAGKSGGDDGNGAAARFGGGGSLAIDGAGNLYVADYLNSTIRKVTPAGDVTTLAGLAGASGSADGTGSAARFNHPYGVTVDPAGIVYVGDQNNTIRKITPEGAVTTLAGMPPPADPGFADGTSSAARFSRPYGVVADAAGNVYVCDQDNQLIRKVTPSGVVTTLAGQPGVSGNADGIGSAARFNVPRGIAMDNGGNLLVVDFGNHAIRKVTLTGVVTTLAGGTFGTADGTGNAAQFAFPFGVALGSGGNAYVADTNNQTIRKITPAGVVTTIAGSPQHVGSADGTAIIARFNFPQGVATDTGGNVFVADTSNNTIRKITPVGFATTVAGAAGSNGSADGIGNTARFNSPIGVAVDGAGNIYLGDTFNHTIRKITPNGTVSTLAGLAGSSGNVNGTGTTARFNLPIGVAVDGPGNVYVADTGNHTIRKITPASAVTTFAGFAGSIGSTDGTGSAARFNSPFGVALDGSANLYVTDTGNNTVRRISPAGLVTTLAGLPGNSGSADGTGGAARFNLPQGVAVDSASKVYVADTSNNTIRKITPTGNVTTLAGSPGVSGTSDGTGSTVRFDGPRGLTVDNAGNLYVADTNNHTIRTGGPPFIISPLVAIGTIGQPFVYQFETIGATSLAVTNLPPGLTFDSTLSAITGKTTAAGTFQVGLAASNAQRTIVATLTVTVQTAPAIGPIITSSSAATGKVGQPFQFQVTTTGASSSATLNAGGLPAGLSVNPVTGLISGTPKAEGSMSVTLTVNDGNFSTTSTLQVTITSDPALPVIISANTVLLTPGEPFSYTINAPAGGNPSDSTSYALAFALPNGLSFNAQTGTISGTFTGSAPFRVTTPTSPDVSGGIITNVQLFATNSHGTSTLPLIFFFAPTGAVNIATRIAVGTGDDVLIAGFIITGNAPKKVVIRAIGPSLPVPGALQNPTLELHDSGSLLGFNDNWRDTQENEIIGTGIPPTDERESAILAYLNPGNFTAVVRGKDNATGIAVVEVYDLGTASLDSSSNAKLAQISTRGTVQGGDNVMIGGFIIKQVATKVIVRAIGPSLTAFGVANALQDTVLELHDGSGATIVSNDDWRTTQEQQIIDTTVPPKDDRESAIVATLSPGAYTAIVRGKGGTTGVALVEVYGLQ
jgi:sugar lactone lactonase YvrE